MAASIVKACDGTSDSQRIQSAHANDSSVQERSPRSRCAESRRSLEFEVSARRDTNWLRESRNNRMDCHIRANRKT